MPKGHLAEVALPNPRAGLASFKDCLIPLPLATPPSNVIE